MFCRRRNLSCVPGMEPHFIQPTAQSLHQLLLALLYFGVYVKYFTLTSPTSYLLGSMSLKYIYPPIYQSNLIRILYRYVRMISWYNKSKNAYVKNISSNLSDKWASSQKIPPCCFFNPETWCCRDSRQTRTHYQWSLWTTFHTSD